MRQRSLWERTICGFILILLVALTIATVGERSVQAQMLPPSVLPEVQDSRDSGQNNAAISAPFVFGPLVTEFLDKVENEYLGKLVDVIYAFRKNSRRIKGLMQIDTERVLEIIRPIVPLFTISIIALVTLGQAIVPLKRRLGAAADPKKIHRKALSAAAVLGLDVILVAIVAYVCLFSYIAIYDIDAQKERFLFATTFVVLFAFVALFASIMRAVFNPNLPELRFIPLSSRGALYWYRTTVLLFGIVASHELLIDPIIAESVSPVVARAVRFFVHVFILSYLLIILIWRHSGWKKYSEQIVANSTNVPMLTLGVLFVYLRWALLIYLFFQFHYISVTPVRLLPVVLKAIILLAAYVAFVTVLCL